MRSKELGSTSHENRDSKEWTGIFVIFPTATPVQQAFLKLRANVIRLCGYFGSVGNFYAVCVIQTVIEHRDCHERCRISWAARLNNWINELSTFSVLNCEISSSSQICSRMGWIWPTFKKWESFCLRHWNKWTINWGVWLQNTINTGVMKSCKMQKTTEHGRIGPVGYREFPRCALCTNVAPALRASNKKQLSFYCVIPKLNNEKW